MSTEKYKKLAHCKACGERFVVTHGLQLYCPKHKAEYIPKLRVEVR